MRHLALVLCGATLASLLASTAVDAQQTPTFIGKWQGAIEIRGPRGSREPATRQTRRIPTSLEITMAADGSYAVKQISVSQGNAQIPVETVTVEGETIRWTAPGVRGSYVGQLSKDGAKLTGRWTQFGSTNPLNFERVAQ